MKDKIENSQSNIINFKYYKFLVEYDCGDDLHSWIRMHSINKMKKMSKKELKYNYNFCKNRKKNIHLENYWFKKWQDILWINL